MPRFRDRRDAGQQLAEVLRVYARSSEAIVLGLPRGGVPVAYEIAMRLELPLDVFVVRKLGVPGHEELAFGAIASSGVQVLHQETVDVLGISPAVVERVAAAERLELDRRERLYRAGLPPLRLENRMVILVDDGLATGATMAAAVAGVRAGDPREVVVAVPVASREAVADLDRVADACIALQRPVPFLSVGAHYERFDQTSDDEVRALLAAAHERPLGAKAAQ